jgi:hypothetical protein
MTPLASSPVSIAQRWIIAVGCLCVVIGSTINADAQDRIGLTVAAGAVINTESPPAEDFTEPFFVFGVQRVIKNYVVIEGDASYWAHTFRHEFGPRNINGPNGVIGTVQGGEIVDTNKEFIFGMNVLVRSTGKVRVFGGVGAALVVENSDYQQQDFGCSPSLDPRTCSRYVNQRTNGPMPLFRVLGGVEVPVSARAAVVGAVRRDTVTWEDFTTNVAVTAGVRFSFH